MSSKHAAESAQFNIERLIYKNTPLNGLKTPFFSVRSWGVMDWFRH